MTYHVYNIHLDNLYVMNVVIANKEAPHKESIITIWYDHLSNMAKLVKSKTAYITRPNINASMIGRLGSNIK
jgi:hypothetical protein